MATLVGAIIDYYSTDAGANAAALRTALGTGKMFGDKAPEGTAMPYCIVSEIGTVQIGMGKGYSYRLDNCEIQFDVYSTGAAKADEVLEALENLFLSGNPQVALTISNRIHLGTMFNFRQLFPDPAQTVFHGVLELNFEVQK